MSHEAILRQLRREMTAAEYEQIRAEWKAHSLAEDKRDIAGLLATLTEDCVYELPQVGQRWVGHQGAKEFYLGLLSAFPDIHFDLQNIVIGPQGVFEEAHVTGTHERDWLDFVATGQAVEFEVMILFPWDAERKKFKGERVYYFGLEI
jgi:predicted ester cyclase